jgi:hypothetical protein
MIDHAKSAADAASITAAFAAFCGLLQPIAALVASLLSILWLSIQLRDYVRRKHQ